MAIDTAEKRRCALDFGKYCGTGMPIPMGIIPAPSRAHICNVWLEFFGPPTPPPGIFYYWRNRNNVLQQWVGRIVPQSTWQEGVIPQTTWEEKVTPGDGTTQREE